MPLSNDVKLRRTKKPVFPDTCIACGQAHPGHSLEYSGRASSWVHLFLWWYPGSKHTVAVPACPPCASVLRRNRILRGLLSWAAIAVSVAVVIYFFPPKRGPLRKWIFLGSVVLGYLPMMAWSLFHPPPFDMTIDEDAVTYEFKDELYAHGFAAANNAEVE